MTKKLPYAAVAILLLPLVHAAFPYSADWLPYADYRIVYEVPTAAVTSNTPNIYVEITLDSTQLQEFIDKWSAYCDDANKYDWFYPTFTYASEYDNTQRMLEVVEYNGWQTFTVGACGTVSLPTRFVVKLPDGVLDGGASYASYRHYVYAYLKFPYVDDFYDNPISSTPSEYDLVSGAPTVVFNSDSFGRGAELDMTGVRLRLRRSFVIDTSKPFIVCYHAIIDTGPKFIVNIGGTEYSIDAPNGIDPNGRCFDFAAYLRSKGLSGSYVPGYMDVTSYVLGYQDYAHLYYLWIIPPELVRDVLYVR